ncbi:MBL fold metallo-hydrolase [Bacillus timonensis]|nr:MBL fold metallo-hydrolase [Bacillus timonensis]
MNIPKKLSDRIYLIDDYDLGRKGRTGTYVILEDKVTLIETCASPSIPHIKQGLRHLQIKLEDVEYIIVTHIHLDHAGGAGLLLKDCPNAKVVVHPKGARHLADPTRLIAGAKAVYGKDFERLFDPILPVLEDQLIEKHDQETLSLSPSCSLTFIDTPGHANHHYSIYDPISNGIFTGDTIGIFYSELFDDGIELFLPSTSPNQFDPEKMLQSLSLIESMNVSHIFFGHYGMSSNVKEVYRQIRFWLPHFVNAAKERDVTLSLHDQILQISEQIYVKVASYLDEKNIPISKDLYDILHLDLQVSAMGLIDYLTKVEK